MPYVRKTYDLYVVQQYTCMGWEDVCASEAKSESRRDLRDYRENMPEFPVRMIKRRIPLPN